MIHCPSCGSSNVTEERHIEMPTEALTSWMKVLLWPFRMPGMAIVTVIATLLVLGMMFPISHALEPVTDGEDVGPGLAACLATLLLGLYAVVMTALPRYLIKLFMRGEQPGQTRLSDLPLTYHRTCQDCQCHWTWNPEDPADHGLQRQAPPTSPRKTTQLDPNPVPETRGRTQVPFTCPSCGTQSSYDPWMGSATCPQCGYSPARGRRMRSTLQRAQIDAYLPYLRDYFDHWDGVEPQLCLFDAESAETAQASFRAYQTALGEVLHPSPGTYYSTGYFRHHNPRKPEILDFVEAYSVLRKGDRQEARRMLKDMSIRSPQFVEPWLWLAALNPDPQHRSMLLEHAYVADPGHPLAADIRAIASGEIELEATDASEPVRAEAHPCPKCGGKLHYEPGAREVECEHCGSTSNLRLLDILSRPAPYVSAMRLRRKVHSQVWSDLERIVACDACGSRISLSDRFAKECAFCGSANVLVQDVRIPLHQPDGFLPFAIDAESVSKLIQQGRPPLWKDYWGWRVYRDLVVERIAGLYVPFWVFDGVVEPIWARLATDGTLSKLSGPDSPISVVDLLVPGTDRLPPSHLDQVSDYDIRTLAEYEPSALADWPAMLYDLDVEDAVEDAYDAMITLAHSRLGPPILVGVEDPSESRAIRTLQVSQTTYQLVLLPLWIAYVRSRIGRSMAWINGQTGTTLISFLGPAQQELQELAEDEVESTSSAPERRT